MIQESARRATKPLLCLALLLGLSACQVGPDYEKPKDIEKRAGASFRGAGEVKIASGDPAENPWWRSFGDDGLSAAVEAATRGNLKLAAAAARLQQSRAFLDGQEAGRLPVVGANASANHQELHPESISSRTQSFASRNTPRTARFETWTAGVQASWELDLFGRVARIVEAAEADVEAEIEVMNGLKLSIAADVSSLWCQLAINWERRRVLERRLASLQSKAELVAARVNGGLSSELELAQARAQLANLRSEAPLLESQERALEARLRLALGDLGASFDAARVSQPQPPEQLALGIPAQLLQSRPDLRVAERRFAAEVARIGAREAEFYPQVTINGQFDLRARDIDKLIDGRAAGFDFGPTISIPIFQAGRLSAQLSAQEARAEEARIRLEDNFVRAVAEVEEAIASYVKGQARLEQVREARILTADRLRLAEDQFQAGAVSYLEVTDAQSALYAQEDLEAAVRLQVLQGAIAIERAIGGGWAIRSES